MKLLSRTVTAPASWASALVNGDQSGLSADDVIAMNAWMKRELAPGESVVGTATGAEAYFSKAYWLYDPRYGAGDVMEFITLKERTDDI